MDRAVPIVQPNGAADLHRSFMGDFVASKKDGFSMDRHHPDDDHDDHGGLHRDLSATGAAMGRRHILRMAARLGMSAGAFQLLGCGASATARSTASAVTTAGAAGACPSRVPEETAGPFPGDGSNGP